MNKIETLALSQIKSLKLAKDLQVEVLLQKLRQDEIFAAAESERDTIGFKMAQMRYRNEDFGILNEQYQCANKKVTERLFQLNHEPNELIPNYACTICNDTGFNDGKLCKCVTMLAYKMLKNNCKTMLTDIDDFSKIKYDILPDKEVAQYKKIASMLNKYSLGFSTNKTNVLGLSGEQGTGKTYLMSVLANSLMKKCYSVVFYNAVQLNKEFLKYHLAPIEEKESLFAPLIEASFLVIDDLGAENLIKNVTETYIYELLVMREGKATGFTSNMSASQLVNHYGHRIASRLCAKDTSFIINFEGTDLRFVKK